MNKHLSQLVLKRAGMTDQSFAPLALNFPSKIERLDLSHNPALTAKSYQLLSEMVLDHYIKLTHINMEGNGMGDSNVGILADMIIYICTV